MPGDAEPATPQLAAETYADLRRAAAALLARERIDHTLEPTALVHEAWLRVARSRTEGGHGSPHDAALVAVVMRHVLVDHARARAAVKRGGGGAVLSLDVHAKGADAPGSSSEEAGRAARSVLEVDDALRRLELLDPQLVRIVELRFFAGCELDSVAAALGCSVRTVTRRWQLARAFLARELSEHESDRP